MLEKPPTTNVIHVSRRGKIVLLILCGLAVAALVIVALVIQWVDRDRCYTAHFRNAETEKLKKDSPHLQLVGHVRHQRHYGTFSRNRRMAAFSEANMTVLCRGGTYFAAWGRPRDFLRSLLDRDQHPELATKPRKLEELTAQSDAEALKLAADRLRPFFDGE